MEDVIALVERVREIAYAIHVYHGNGHLERIYENALANRLRKVGLRVDQQHVVHVFDEDGTLLGACTVDLLVDQKLVLELKAVTRLNAEHISQIIGYLKACRIEHGLLINFGSSRFEIRKFAFTPQRRPV
jgi:GxxExxY protein